MVESESPKGPDRVLVVDDESDTRKALEKSLRRLGYDVSSAANGEEGLKLALELRPQVILSDIRMPQVDGHTLLRRLATHDLDTAVIVMSAHGNMDDVIDVLRNGAVDYLKKPWAPSELVSAVGRAVDIHDQRRSTRQVQGTAEPPAAATAGAIAAKQPEKPKTDPAFSAILEQLRRGDMALPPFPAVLSELRSLLSRPEAAMHEITALVERDPRLAAQVLRISSSAQYARGSRINDIRTAVGRIGLRQLQSLVQTVIMRASHQAKDATLRRMQTRIWRYSIARAVSMRGLAELAGPGAHLEPETAYLAGLLADVGASFLLWVVGERIASGTRPPADPESYALGLRDQHQEVGAALLARWELDPIATLIARTHHLEAPPAPPSGYWSLTILGTAMADGLSAGDDPTRSAPPSPELVDRCGVELRIGTTAATKISDSVRREFESVMEAVA